MRLRAISPSAISFHNQASSSPPLNLFRLLADAKQRPPQGHALGRHPLGSQLLLQLKQGRDGSRPDATPNGPWRQKVACSCILHPYLRVSPCQSTSWLAAPLSTGSVAGARRAQRALKVPFDCCFLPLIQLLQHIMSSVALVSAMVLALSSTPDKTAVWSTAPTPTAARHDGPV